MHIWRNKKPAQHPAQAGWQAYIAAIEHGGNIERYLKDHHSNHRRTQHQDCGKLDQHRENNFKGVKAGSGGNIEIEVSMVNPMQAPERRDGVDHHMLQIDHKTHHHRNNHWQQEGIS